MWADCACILSNLYIWFVLGFVLRVFGEISVTAWGCCKAFKVHFGVSVVIINLKHRILYEFGILQLILLLTRLGLTLPSLIETYYR